MQKEFASCRMTCDRCGREEFIGEGIKSSDREWKTVLFGCIEIDLCYRCTRMLKNYLQKRGFLKQQQTSS